MQISISVPRTIADAQILLDTIDFRLLNPSELEGFAGTEEGDLIGEFGDFGICLIGEFTVSFIDIDEMEEVQFAYEDDKIVEML